MSKPDWPPQVSAVGLPEGERRYGSTRQLFEVQNGQWVRVPPDNKPHLVDTTAPGHC